MQGVRGRWIPRVLVFVCVLCDGRGRRIEGEDGKTLVRKKALSGLGVFLKAVGKNPPGRGETMMLAGEGSCKK